MKKLDEIILDIVTGGRKYNTQIIAVDPSKGGSINPFDNSTITLENVTNHEVISRGFSSIEDFLPLIYQLRDIHFESIEPWWQ